MKPTAAVRRRCMVPRAGAGTTWSRPWPSRHANLLAKDGRGRTAADVAMGSASASGRASAEAHPETAALLRQLMADEAQPTARN